VLILKLNDESMIYVNKKRFMLCVFFISGCIHVTSIGYMLTVRTNNTQPGIVYVLSLSYHTCMC